MKTVLFVVQFAIPAVVVSLFALIWVIYLAVMPTLTADVIMGLHSLGPQFKCGEWQLGIEQKSRLCTLDGIMLQMHFRQYVSKQGDGWSTDSWSQEFHSERKTGRTILISIGIFGVAAILWYLWVIVTNVIVVYFFKKVSCRSHRSSEAG